MLARTDAGGLKIGNDPVDLARLARQESERVRRRGRVTVDDTAIADDAKPVRGSADWLAAVVRNLLDNAERHAASTIIVEVTNRGPSVEMAVANDGPAIPPEARDRVFERFARLDESRDRDAGGAGLGLSIARDVLAAHHGTIEVADSPEGARFVVRLPAAPLGETEGS
jgi:signal transduction histidine kinase